MKKPLLMFLTLLITLSLVLASFCFAFAADPSSFYISSGQTYYVFCSCSPSSSSFQAFNGSSINHDGIYSDLVNCSARGGHCYDLWVDSGVSFYSFTYTCTSGSNVGFVASYPSSYNNHIDYASSVPLVSPDIPLNFDLYVGNGLLIDLSGLSSSVSISFSAGNNTLGTAGFNYGNSFTSGQSYYLSAAADLETYNFSNNNFTLIHWLASSTNIVGKTTSASSSIDISNPSGYLYIFNPLQGSEISIKNGQQVNSGYIHLSSDSSFASVRQFALESVASVGSGQDINIFDSGNYIDSSGNLVDSSGNPTTQTPGGLNHITSDNLGSKIEQVLDSFVQSIASIFAPATNAINTLINSGSVFMQRLLSLYGWLPADIVAVINSALVLFIVIGTLKLLI